MHSEIILVAAAAALLYALAHAAPAVADPPRLDVDTLTFNGPANMTCRNDGV